MKKYFFKDGSTQLGPFSFEELKNKNITADTPVWYEGLDQWTTAGNVEELKELFTLKPPPPVIETKAEEQFTTTRVETPIAAAPVEEIKPVTATATAAPAAAATVSKMNIKPAKQVQKGTAWVSWVLAIMILGGAGYYIYQDMGKNKTASVNTINTDTTKNTNTETTGDNIIVSPTDSEITVTNTDTVGSATVPPTTVTTVTNPNDPAAKKIAADAKKKLLAAQAKKKAEEDKKKQLALDAKKTDEENKKMLAAQALAAKEAEMRNNWPRYVTMGSIKYVEHDGIKPFLIPVYNRMPATLEKVTLRVDYLKKEGKIVGTETLVMNFVPANGIMNVQASGNKKAKKANVYLTGINSRGMHFCYPLNNGNPADPYFCN